MKGIVPLAAAGGVEPDPLLEELLLDFDLLPDELTLTFEYIAPSVC